MLTCCGTPRNDNSPHELVRPASTPAYKKGLCSIFITRSSTPASGLAQLLSAPARVWPLAAQKLSCAAQSNLALTSCKDYSWEGRELAAAQGAQHRALKAKQDSYVSSAGTSVLRHLPGILQRVQGIPADRFAILYFGTIEHSRALPSTTANGHHARPHAG